MSHLETNGLAFREYLNPVSSFAVSDQQLLSPEELAALFRRLDALIAEAKTLQEQITDRLVTTRRQDRPVRTGQPARRPTPPRKKTNS